MFVYFKANNYKSFGLETEGINNTLSMNYLQDKDLTPEKFKEFKEHNFINTNFTNSQKDDYKKLSKKKAIYGNNGAGKSNLIDAVITFQRMVIGSKNFEDDELNNFFKPYAFVDNSIKSNIGFEFGCIIEGKLFEYSISYSKTKIIAENLRVNNKKYIHRDINKIDIMLNKEDDLIIDVVKRETKQYQLALSMVVVFKKEDDIFNTLYNYIRTKIVIYNPLSSLPVFLRPSLRVKTEQQEDFKKDFLPYLQAADIGIADLNFDAKGRLFSVHKVDGKEYKLDFYNSASLGSIEILDLAVTFDRVLKNGGCLFVDEIEEKKHPLNIGNLLEYIDSPETNKHNMQIVFTSHNTHLIEYITDANQIAIINKDSQNQVSNIIELNSFDEEILTYNNNPVKNFVAKYYAGIFDGVPNSSGEELYNSITKANKNKSAPNDYFISEEE